MGNTQFIDILISLGETAVSKEALKLLPGEYVEPTTSSLFKIHENYDLLVNTEGKELKRETFRVDDSFQDVVFFSSEEEVRKYDFVHYKRTLKKNITEKIFLIQNTKEFQAFLKKVNVSTPVLFVNLINAVIDDHISPLYIYKHVAMYKVFSFNSSVVIDFVNASNYNSGLVYYVRNNLQTLYIANVLTVLLTVFLKVEITSKIANISIQFLKNYSNGEKEAFLSTMIFGIVLIIAAILVYFILKKFIL